MGWDGLSSQWKQAILLHSFYNHKTNDANSEDTNSIAMMLTILEELDLHLKEVSFNFIYHHKLLSKLQASQSFLLLLLETCSELAFALHFIGVHITGTLLNHADRGLHNE